MATSNKETRVVIYGYGWVGKAMHTLFPDASIHDPEQGFFSKEVGDVAFVCVPTPLKEGKLDCSIVAGVLREAKEPLIVVRSTVMPGTCEKYDAVFQPEYLGETVNHPMTDQHSRPFIILGGSPEKRRKVISLYMTVFNANLKIRQMTSYEAEVVKLSENRAIAFKVAQCQELYDACESAKIDYYAIRDAVYGDDPRMNLWWTAIYKERGFNSKCIPKDVYGWASWAESCGYTPELTNKLLEVNDALISNS